MRLALGATRMRVLRLLLVENLVLAIPGAVVGPRAGLVRPAALLLEDAGRRRARSDLLQPRARSATSSAFSVLAAIASALAFGFAPAWRGSRSDLLAVDQRRPVAAGRDRRGRFRAALVVAQVAVSMLLLIGSGLVARSFDAARAADAGFDATNVISIGLDLKPAGYDESRGRAFFDDLLSSIRAEPGVEAATLAANHPMTLVNSGAQRVVDRRLRAASRRRPDLSVERRRARLLPDPAISDPCRPRIRDARRGGGRAGGDRQRDVGAALLGRASRALGKRLRHVHGRVAHHRRCRART